MSKSEEFRIKVMQRESHDFRRRKVQEILEENERDWKDVLRSYRRGDLDWQQRARIHEDE